MEENGPNWSVSFLSDEPESSFLNKFLYRIDSQKTFVRETGQKIARLARRLVSERGIEIFEMEETMGWAKYVVEALPIPTVVRLHGPWFLLQQVPGRVSLSRKDARRVEFEGQAIRRARAVSSPSLRTAELVARRYGINVNDIRIVPNAVPGVEQDDLWSHEDGDDRYILFVGRFDRIKGADIVLKAFNAVAEQNSIVRLIFVGPDKGLEETGAGRVHIAEFVERELGAEARRRFSYIGARTSMEITQLRRKSSLVVVASRYENYPTVVLESMASGNPIVATRVGGIPEILQDGRNALLVESEDPQSLASACIKLLESDELAVRLGRNAKCDHAHRFTPQTVVRQVVEFYDELVATHKRQVSGGVTS